MLITCKLKNLCESDYNIIVLRKFYQVIFWETDLRTFNIYTSVIIGSEDDNSTRLKIKENYDLEFSFTCVDQNSNLVSYTVDFFDKTASFKSDIGAWKAVWGDTTNTINSADDFNKRYTELFGIRSNIQTNVNNNYLFVKNTKKNNDTSSSAITKIISFTQDDTNNINKKYRIKPDITELYDNIEIANFTLTTIKFEKNQSTTHLNYIIELEDTQKFKALDNSIYFILPSGFDAKGKLASIILYNDPEPQEKDNPYQSLDPNNKKYIQEWLDKGIEHRKYYRVFNNSFKSFAITDRYYKFLFNFRIINMVNPIINQFIYGFLVAIFFTYGLDQTRLTNFKKLFAFYEFISPDINFFITYSLLFFSIVFKISMGNAIEGQISFVMRRIAIFISSLWFFWIFIYPNPQKFYGSQSSEINFDIAYIDFSCMLNILAILSNAISLFLIVASHKDEIPFLEQLKTFNNFLKR